MRWVRRGRVAWAGGPRQNLKNEEKTKFVVVTTKAKSSSKKDGWQVFFVFQNLKVGPPQSANGLQPNLKLRFLVRIDRNIMHTFVFFCTIKMKGNHEIIFFVSFPEHGGENGAVFVKKRLRQALLVSKQVLFSNYKL